MVETERARGDSVESERSVKAIRFEGDSNRYLRCPIKPGAGFFKALIDSPHDKKHGHPIETLKLPLPPTLGVFDERFHLHN